MITYPKAEDENGEVHIISEITQENRTNHKYYCLGCGKEMVPVLFKEGQKDDHFRHKVNDVCNPETYLHNLAKKTLAKKFEKQRKFEVSYYAVNECPKKDTCPVFSRFHWENCYGNKLYKFDLKEQYDTCQIEGVYNGFRADVLLTNRENSDIPPIFLEVSVSHDCTKEKLDSGIQIIEIKISREEDIKRPIIENEGLMVPIPKLSRPLSSCSQHYSRSAPDIPFIKFHNFERLFHHDDIRKFDLFALFSNGRMGCQEDFIHCKDVGAKYLKDSVFELSLLSDPRRRQIDDRNNALFRLGLTQAMLHNQPIRHCIYCMDYPKCTVPIEIEQLNRRTGEKEKVVKRVFNSQLNNNQFDKYELALKCNNWHLCEVKCRRVMSDFDKKSVFIWEESKNNE